MAIRTVAIMGTGEMGSAVGAAVARRGYRLVTDLTGRSPHSRNLAAQADFEDLGTLEAVVTEADLLLSILPAAQASASARRVGS